MGCANNKQAKEISQKYFNGKNYYDLSFEDRRRFDALILSKFINFEPNFE